MALPDVSTTGPEQRVVRLADTSALIAAIPVLLGFHPRESLVLIATGGGAGRRLGLTLRADLPPPDDVELAAEAAARGLMLDTPAGAAVVVIASRGATSGGDPPHRRLAERITELLEEHGVDVHTMVWAEGTGRGDRWSCFEPCGCGGVLPDPCSTPFAAAAVADGQVVYAERAQLRQLVAPAGGARIRRRELRLIEAIDAAFDTSDAVPDAEAGVAMVDVAIVDAAAGRLVLDDERVVALATALTVPEVRDVAMRRCAGPNPEAAELLWAALARETPDPESATPAALVAASALLRGDGALVNVALDRAEQAWPGHRLTGVLRAAADIGMRPSDFQACLMRGIDEPGGPERRSR